MITEKGSYVKDSKMSLFMTLSFVGTSWRRCTLKGTLMVHVVKQHERKYRGEKKKEERRHRGTTDHRSIVWWWQGDWGAYCLLRGRGPEVISIVHIDYWGPWEAIRDNLQLILVIHGKYVIYSHHKHWLSNTELLLIGEIPC